MKVLIPRILLFSIFILAISCFHTSNRASNVDGFYSKKGEWDSARIPFLKPYEAINVTKEFGWFMNLKGFDGDTGFPNIKKANVIDSIILIYSANTILHGANVKESWHVIIPGKHIEKGFSSHQEYVNYLFKLGVKVEPTLHNIDLIANYFEGHDTIDWTAIN